MTANLARQRGMTTAGMMIIAAMVIVFVLFGLKLYPIYYDSFKVGSALTSLKESPDIQTKPSHEIVDMIIRRLKVDNMEDLDKSDITVSKAGASLTVAIDYEVRRSLIGNIDIVVHFEKEVNVGN